MSEAPLSRDQQIELMRTVRERHAAHVARWVATPEVRELMTKEPHEEPASYDRQYHKVACCA